MKIKTAKQYLIEKWPERFKNSGLTQQELADKTNLSRQSINDIMAGKSVNLRATTVDVMEKVFKDLGV